MSGFKHISLSKAWIVYAFSVILITVFSCSDSNYSGSAETFIRTVVDTNPPVVPLAPDESIRKIQLPPGFRVELVASEPMVQEPVAIAWDGNGRMFVAEMNTFMIDAAASGEFEASSRIKLLEDTDGDGKMAKKHESFFSEGNCSFGKEQVSLSTIY